MRRHPSEEVSKQGEWTDGVVVAVVDVDDDAFALRRNLALLEDKA